MAMMGLIVCIVLLILGSAHFHAADCRGWVYLDAKEHGERGWMWVCIILLSSPILGGLIYLIARREERLPWPLLRMDGGQKRQLLRALRAESPCL